MDKKRPTKVLLMFFLVIILSGVASAGDMNETRSTCEYVYYFIIDHLGERNILSYTETDVIGLKYDLMREQDIYYDTTADLYPFIFNYSGNCINLTSHLIVPLEEEIPIQEEFNYVCVGTKINKTLIYFYDWDWSLPIPKIHKGMEKCSDMRFKKWFFDYKKTGIQDYSISGLKLWWIFILIALFSLFVYLKVHIQVNKIIEREGS